MSGTHNRSTIHGFHGAKQEMTHRQPFTFTADHPPVLVGADNGPTPAEYLLHALAACLTAGIATIAAARGVTLTEVSSTVEGDLDLLGVLGLSDQVRNGYQQIRVGFRLRGDDPEKLRSVVEQSRRRSAVFDVVTNGARSSSTSTPAEGHLIASRRAVRPGPQPAGRAARIPCSSYPPHRTVVTGAGQAGLAASRCLTAMNDGPADITPDCPAQWQVSLEAGGVRRGVSMARRCRRRRSAAELDRC